MLMGEHPKDRRLSLNEIHSKIRRLKFCFASTVEILAMKSIFVKNGYASNIA